MNLRLRPYIHLKIKFAADAVLRILPILAHHDDRCLDSGEHRQKEVKEDEWVGIPCLCGQHYVYACVNGHQNAERDDERPRAAEAGHTIGDALAEGGFFLDQVVRVAAQAETTDRDRCSVVNDIGYGIHCALPDLRHLHSFV